MLETIAAHTQQELGGLKAAAQQFLVEVMWYLCLEGRHLAVLAPDGNQAIL